MNICAISGAIHKNAVVRGKKTKALAFTVITRQPAVSGNGDTSDETRLSYVPCVIFDPEHEVEELLVTEGAGVHVELQGRIQGSRFEGPNEQERYNADVIVFKKSFAICRTLPAQA